MLHCLVLYSYAAFTFVSSSSSVLLPWQMHERVALKHVSIVCTHNATRKTYFTHALCIRHLCVAALTFTAECVAQAHTDVRRLEFLPYHFLLGSVGDLGVLRFQVSIHHVCIPP